MKQVTVTLSQTEWKRALVVQRLLDGQMSVEEAALVLGLSQRQIFRLKAKVKAQGPAALAHGNRGRQPPHALPQDLRQRVLELAQTKYKGCNYTFLSELLGEFEGISLSPSSVRRILKAAGIPSPRQHRPPKPHRRRPRKPQRGMLVLLDGSDHHWLEDRGPRLTLLAAIDDATGQLLAALFRPSEDFEGYRLLLQQMAITHGLPLAIYSDRHSIFLSPQTEDNLPHQEQLLGHRRPLTQIGRILNELGIQHLLAHSPQAKGRIERAFGTLQERLVIALRLAGVCTLDQANAFLPHFLEDYNRKFAVPPADSASAFRPLPAHLRLEHVFCRKEYRTLNPGYVIHYHRHTYRVVTPKGAPVIPLRAVVEVHLLPDGHLSLGWQGHIYPLQPFPQDPPHPQPAPSKESAGSTPPRKPAANHPWKKPWSTRRAIISRR